MKTLDRYLAGIFVKNLILAILSMTCLFLFQALLGDLFDHTYPPEQVLVYHFLNLPNILVQMTPPGVLLATVFTLSGLSRSNELVACHAIGVGLGRIMTLVLSVVFIVSCMTLMMEDRILPPTFKKREIYRMRVMDKRKDFFLDIKQDKIWYRSRNLIYNLQLFEPKTNTILGMAVYKFDDDFNLVQVLNAERALFTAGGWKMTNGTVTVFNPSDDFPITRRFTERDLVIRETPHDFQEIEKEVDSLRLKELYHYIQRVHDAGANTKAYEVKFQSKISLAFIPLVMCILAVPFSTRGRREGGAAKDLGICLAITFFYWLFYSVSLSLGTNGTIPPVLAAWTPSLIFASLAGGLMIRQRR